MQTGLVSGLMSPDASVADAAVSDLTYYWFDDGHSGFGSSSWMADSTPEDNYGFSNQALSNMGWTAANIRENYPDAALPYYEVGDTAYVTFDEFQITQGAAGPVDYYELDESGAELPMDTFSLIINAHRQIIRENSPIKNVVLDLSCNGGGSCVVRFLTTAWGTSFQLSGTYRIAFVKNGSYYDVDRGVDPDHIIDTYEHFYDREALTEYIHSLY